jgi:indolepyruvate ferredoxin oxidoreductase
VVNSHSIITGEFTRNTEFRIPADRLEVSLQARLRDRLDLFDATELAAKLMGDSIFSNMMVFGAAWQRGYIPLSHAAITEAIRLNGAAVERNTRAFDLGRWAVLHPEAAAKALTPDVAAKPLTLDERIELRAAHLVAYQSPQLANRYRKLVARAEAPQLREAVAKGYHKLLAYKDEYEVARLHLETEAKAREEFDGDFRMTFHLAPPILSRMGPDGRPMKRAFGPWVMRVYRVLARLKRLRGTPLDPFGHSTERRLERRLIRQYEADMDEVLTRVRDDTLEVAVALAELPLQIRGFGPVKMANAEKAARRRDEMLQRFRAGGAPLKQAAE